MIAADMCEPSLAGNIDAKLTDMSILNIGACARTGVSETVSARDPEE
jgi:hypothetical protein